MRTLQCLAIVRIAIACAADGLSCNAECQKNDWKLHSKICQALKEDKADRKTVLPGIADHQFTSTVAKWIVGCMSMLYQIGAHCVENDRQIAQTSHTYFVVRAAPPESSVKVHILAIYRVATEFDESAFEDIYSIKSHRVPKEKEQKRRLAPTTEEHRIFVTEIHTHGGHEHHAVRMPLINLENMRIPDPLSLTFCVRALEANVPSLSHVGAALKVNVHQIHIGMDESTMPQPPELPDATAFGFWNGQMGMFERRNGKAKFSPSSLSTLFTGQREWIDIPANAF